MKKDAFLLLSLEEEKAKKLAAVVSNESSIKIMNYLAEKEDGTETDIATALSLPISTVHYNMKLLQDSGLVVAEEFHYSKKGREVLHYKLANKYIIIAPKNTEGIPAKLRRLLPAVTFLAAGSIIAYFVTAVNKGTEMATRYGPSMASEAEKSSVFIPGQAPPQFLTLHPALYLFAGGILALAAYFAYDVLKERFRR